MRSRLALAAMVVAAASSTGALTAEASVLPPFPDVATAHAGALPHLDRVLDPLGRPTPEVMQHVRTLASQPGVPEDARRVLLAAVAFYEGDGDAAAGAPPLPSPEVTGQFTQFAWPTLSARCIGGTDTSVGTAIAVPGPAPLPLPGPKQGDTAFVFTALGTTHVSLEADQAMRVHWVNITTGRMGTATLTDTGINPDGPATLSAIAPTGSGTVLAAIEGSVVTDAATCTFLPTAALFHVGSAGGAA